MSNIIKVLLGVVLLAGIGAGVYFVGLPMLEDEPDSIQPLADSPAATDDDADGTDADAPVNGDVTDPADPDGEAEVIDDDGEGEVDEVEEVLPMGTAPSRDPFQPLRNRD